MTARNSWAVLLLLTLGKVKCMSLDEILDFSSYLERTSLIDKPRIECTEGWVLDEPETTDPTDEEDSASADAWENSGKFEGDIILNARQRRVIVEDVAEGLSRNGLNDITKRWPNNELVYYIQKEHFSSGHVQAIMDGMEDIARSSCITFRPYKKGDRDAVVIVGNRRGCFSAVGYQGGFQVLNLSGRHPLGRGCFRHGTVVHEILHSLGFYHMQSSPDRDDYVDVQWDNIIKGARHNFRKYNTFSVSDFGVPYDYESVLHYSKKAFSRNGQLTLVPKKAGAEIGQRIGMSNGDVQKLNKMYCDNNSDSVDDVKETPKKAAIKKKSNNNKPFEGHGLGYYQGKSVIVKLPKVETIEINPGDVEHIPRHITEYITPRFHDKGTYSGREDESPKTDTDASDEVFIDVSKLMAGGEPYYKSNFANFQPPKIISNNADNYRANRYGHHESQKLADYSPSRNRGAQRGPVSDSYRNFKRIFSDSRKPKNKHRSQDDAYPEYRSYEAITEAPAKNSYDNDFNYGEHRIIRQKPVKYHDDFGHGLPAEADSTEEEFNLYSIPSEVRDWFGK